MATRTGRAVGIWLTFPIHRHSIPMSLCWSRLSAVGPRLGLGKSGKGHVGSTYLLPGLDL